MMLTPSKPQNERSPSLSLVRGFSVTLLLLSTASFSYAQQPPPGGGRGGPPPEAFEACESLAENDVCTVETPRGEMTGICRQDRRSDALMCAPKNKPKKGDRSGPPSDGSDQSSKSDPFEPAE